eukprot:g263.t1
MNYGRETLCRSDGSYGLRKRDLCQVGFSEYSFGSSSFRGNYRFSKTQTTNLPSRRVTQMGNKGSTGPFAPIVVITRDIVGTKKFNTFRGKAIALHSQVIKSFCEVVGAERKQAQGVIRLAKKNGERLGFLA